MIMKSLITQLTEQFSRGNGLQQHIRENLKGISYEF